MLIFNHKRIVGFEYRKGKKGWKFHKAIKDKEVVTEIGKEVFRPPKVDPEHQKRLHLKLLLDALSARNLDGGSMTEISGDKIYRVEIEAKTKHQNLVKSKAVS